MCVCVCQLGHHCCQQFASKLIHNVLNVVGVPLCVFCFNGRSLVSQPGSSTGPQVLYSLQDCRGGRFTSINTQQELDGIKGTIPLLR